MNANLAVALLLMMQPGAGGSPQPLSVAYVAVPGQDPASVARLEQLLAADPELTAALPRRLERARLNPAAFADCRQHRLPDHLTRCVRALLPAEEEGAPVIALWVERVVHSDVTGGRVDHTNNVWCIGHRGVGRAEIWDRLTSPSPVAAARVRERLPACLAEAVGGPSVPGLGPDEASGTPLWQVPVRPEALARDAATARGRAAERAIVEILDITTTHQNSGRCSVRARVAYVEGGERLRRDDQVAFAAPCSYGAEDPVSRMLGRNGFTIGGSARIYLDRRDAELVYLEAL